MTQPVVVDCGAFGASCGDFDDSESGAPFEWCDCGELEELEGFCLGGRLGITCLEGLGGLADCGPGMACVERPGAPFRIGCDCNNFVDGVCPGASCGADPDCETCTPDCEGARVRRQRVRRGVRAVLARVDLQRRRHVRADLHPELHPARVRLRRLRRQLRHLRR